MQQMTTPHADLEFIGVAIDGSVKVRHAINRLGRAITTSQVASMLVDGGLAALGASCGALVLLSDDQRELRVIHAVGLLAGEAHPERRFPLTANFPLADVLRLRQDLWIASPEELEARYPELVPDPGERSWAVLQLAIDGLVLGAVGWSFPERGLTPVQRIGLRGLARAGGEALYRAKLFEAERRARASAEVARITLADQLALAEAARDRLIADYTAISAEMDFCMRRDVLMSEVSSLLDSTTDAVSALTRVARMCLPLLGDWCAVDVLTEDGRVKRAAEVHVNPAKASAPRRNTRRQAPTAIGGRRHAGQLVVPLRIRDHTVGTMSFAAEDHEGSYSDAQVALAERLARRCAAAIEYARLQCSAQQAVQDRELFAAATCHELRTPLSHIKGFVSTLRSADTVWEAERRDDFLAEIEREANRLARLIEDVLEMARVDSSELDHADRAVISPAALVAGGVDLVRDSLSDHELDVQLADELPAVWADASQVERVIANLLDNAAKYSPPDQPISVVGRLVGNAVSLRVEDRGRGMRPEHLERIFEPYFREPPAEYPARPGTGLGLAICRSLIRAQNGRIWAEQRTGGGAAFEFTLPVASDIRTHRRARHSRRYQNGME